MKYKQLMKYNLLSRIILSIIALVFVPISSMANNEQIIIDSQQKNYSQLWFQRVVQKITLASQPTPISVNVVTNNKPNVEPSYLNIIKPIQQYDLTDYAKLSIDEQAILQASPNIISPTNYYTIQLDYDEPSSFYSNNLILDRPIRAGPLYII